MDFPRNSDVYLTPVDYALAVEVRIVGRVGAEGRLWVPTHNRGWLAEPLVEGERSEPSFTLDSRTFENLLKAAQGVVDPSTATERHLQDALNVRDQLLGVVLKSAH